MEYCDVVEKIEKHEAISTKDVTGIQLLSLLYDKIIKDIVCNGTKYEVNFIPITFAFTATDITEEEYPTFSKMTELLEYWVHCYESNKKIYIKIVDLYYEIILDVLETQK